MKDYKIDCDIARDLMPLVIDGVASASGRVAVEEHVAGCVECRKAMEGMRREEQHAEGGEDDSGFARLGKKLRRRFTRQRVAAWLGIALVVALAVVGLGNFAYNQMNRNGMPMRFTGEAAEGVRLARDQYGYLCIQFDVPDSRHPYLGESISGVWEGGRRVIRIVPEQTAWPQLFGHEGITGTFTDISDMFQFIDGRLCEVAYDYWEEYDENGLWTQRGKRVSELPVDELWLGEAGSAILLYSAGDPLPPVIERDLPGVNG